MSTAITVPSSSAGARRRNGEILARAGYDGLPFLRVGGEGRARVRLSGDVSLPGARSWNMFLGPQVLGYYGAFFGAVTFGPRAVAASVQLVPQCDESAGSGAYWDGGLQFSSRNRARHGGCNRERRERRRTANIEPVRQGST